MIQLVYARLVGLLHKMMGFVTVGVGYKSAEGPKSFEKKEANEVMHLDG